MQEMAEHYLRINRVIGPEPTLDSKPPRNSLRASVADDVDDTAATADDGDYFSVCEDHSPQQVEEVLAKARHVMTSLIPASSGNSVMDPFYHHVANCMS